MFIFLNRIIRKETRLFSEKEADKKSLRGFSRRKLFTPLSSRGQIALILIFVIAIVIIFYAISLNLGRIAQIKTSVTLASNQAAAFMGSEMAGYSEYMYQQLGGESKMGDDLTTCKFSGIFKTILGFIIATILTIIIPGLGFSLGAFLFSAAVTGATILIQNTVIEPGFSEQWNKAYDMAGLTQEEQFLERGVALGLQASIDDPERVQDNLDMDLDGLFGIEDEVSRFAVLYTQRIEEAADLDPPRVSLDTINAFLNALQEFMYQGTDDWGLYDPWGNDCPAHPCCHQDTRLPECNCCCLPEAWNYSFGSFFTGSPRGFQDPNYNNRPINYPMADEPNMRPPCCDDPEGHGSPQFCGTVDTSRYPGLDPNLRCPGYGGTPMVLGGTPVTPNDWPFIYDPYFENSLNAFVSFREFLGRDDGHRLRMTSPPGNFSNPQVVDPGIDIDNDGDLDPYFRAADSKGIFPALWGIASLEELPPGGGAPVTEEQCRWCSADHPDCTPATAGLNLDPYCYYANWQDYYNAEVLGNPPVTDYDLCCVTAADYDAVTSYDAMKIPLDECAGADGIEGWWKEGIDDYCSRAWPYYEDCPGKHCPATCSDPCEDNECAPNLQCVSGPDARQWPEDNVDLLIEDTKLFIDWANETLRMGPEKIQKDFKNWWEQASIWLVDPSDGASALRSWAVSLNDWAIELNNHSLPTFLTGAAYTGSTVDTECFSSSEGARGLSDIVSCLEQRRNEYRARADALELCINQCVAIDENTWTNCQCEDCWFYPSSPPTTGPPPASVEGFFPPWNDTVICGTTPSSPVVQDMWGYQLNYLRNLEAKFEERFVYLENILIEAQRVQDGLSEAASMIENFLSDSSITDMRDEYENLIVVGNGFLDGPGLQPFAIYAWATGEDADRPMAAGDIDKKWHIVKSEGRLPGKCNGQCSRRIYSNIEPGWMRYWTYHRGFLGSRRCTSMGDSYNQYDWCDEKDDYHGGDGAKPKNCFRGGRVKSRITRYDQDKDLLLTFANRVPIWRFVFHHPDATDTDQFENQLIALEEACNDTSEPLQAFMINRRDPGSGGHNTRACYDAAQWLLDRGVKSETCVDYFFHDRSGERGFNVKFVDCPGYITLSDD